MVNVVCVGMNGCMESREVNEEIEMKYYKGLGLWFVLWG